MTREEREALANMIDAGFKHVSIEVIRAVNLASEHQTGTPAFPHDKLERRLLHANAAYDEAFNKFVNQEEP